MTDRPTYRRLTLAMLATGIATALLSLPLLVSARAAGPSTLTVTPTADSYVHELQKTTNFGSSSSLGTYGSPDVQSLLRFVLPAAPAGQALSAASLRVSTTTLSSAGSADSQQVRRALDGWDEATVTWNTRPAVTGAALGTLTGPTAVATSYDVALDPSQLGPLLGSSATLALLGTGSDSLWLTSRESPTATARPSLTLTFAAAAASDTTPPSSPTALTAAVDASTVTLAWKASSDDVAVTRYDVHRSATPGFTPGSGTLIGSAAGTGYSDVGRPAGTWYYRVIARDGANNTSGPSNEARADVVSAATRTLIATAAADTYVHGTQKTTNFGTSTSLAAYGSPDLQSYVRVTLPLPPPGHVLASAALRVRTTTLSSAGSTDTQEVRLSDNGWEESTATWNTRPAVGAAVLGRLPGGTAAATSYDVTLNRDGLAPRLGTSVSLAMLGTGTDGLWLTSRESGTVAARPQLVLQFVPGSDDSTAPTPPTGLTATVVSSDVSLSWTAASDDVAVTRYDVHRSAVSGFTPNALTLVGTSSTTAYADPTRPAGRGYYRIVARDAGGNSSPPSSQATAVVQAPLVATTVIAFGDSACAPGTAVTGNACRQADIGSIVTAADPDFLIGLGDLQYDSGTYDQFVGAGAWDATFGAYRSRTLPVLGNHEYTDPSGRGQGYFDYFYGKGVQQGPLGTRPDGYYSATMGAWQLIALNTECDPDIANGNRAIPGGCGVGSPQYQWLERVLASSTASCTLVASHRPRWTTGPHPPYGAMSAMWDLMARSGVDVAIAGHNHNTEVFRRIGASGSTTTPAVEASGIRSFVSGAGGRSLAPFPGGSNAVTAALQARDSSTFGALRLTLRDGSFDWGFQPVVGRSYTGVGTTGAFSGSAESCL
jgi:hypothetical protein